MYYEAESKFSKILEVKKKNLDQTMLKGKVYLSVLVHSSYFTIG